MIRALYYTPGKPVCTDIPPQEFQCLIQDPQSLLWINFLSETPEISEPILLGFGFHQLAIDDALKETHIPKIDDWGEYLYIVLNLMNYQQDNGSFHPEVDELESRDRSERPYLLPRHLRSSCTVA